MLCLGTLRLSLTCILQLAVKPVLCHCATVNHLNKWGKFMIHVFVLNTVQMSLYCCCHYIEVINSSFIAFMLLIGWHRCMSGACMYGVCSECGCWNDFFTGSMLSASSETVSTINFELLLTCMFMFNVDWDLCFYGDGLCCWLLSTHC